MSANLENSGMATGLEKANIHSNPKRAMPKNVQTTVQFLLISQHRVLTIIQSWPIAHLTCKQGYAQNPSSQASAVHDQKLPDVQAWFQRGRRTRDQIVNICWIMEKAREFQKNIHFCFIDYTKAFDYVNHNKLWKILKEMEIPDHPTLPPEKPICKPRSNIYN